ncbi:hypothetical protein PX554_08600 [Sphingomonas sp. H39-1-10]|uniref:hypothetical protein n=1 Tax=Sphingomonas TaxID=13687 RepID=UPI00087E1543|nr:MULTISPECIES: hypothetical protein [Sphingomonas]MDF0488186.1 hypothetical protein [Sphingomonas pollutisoli]SDA33921.1 hypothetical protein SAMN03159340_02994 [Sphingomonas sp. NFR15]
MSEPSFLHFCRRARQEQIAAINATSEAAADAHRRLCTLHAEMACAIAGRSRRARGLIAAVA